LKTKPAGRGLTLRRTRADPRRLRPLLNCDAEMPGFN